MNKQPFSKVELDSLRTLVNKACAHQEEHGIACKDADPLLVRAIATIDELQAKLPTEPEAPIEEHDV